MNKHGQALVEFVLILPVLVFILLLIVDMGRLMIMKNHLESVLNRVDKTTTSVDDKEYQISIEHKDGYINLKSCINVYTPGLSKILGNPACVTSSISEKE